MHARAAPRVTERGGEQAHRSLQERARVPECSEGYHGYLMLLNIDGDDSKLSCELQHGYYSWVGAAVCTSNLNLTYHLLLVSGAGSFLFTASSMLSSITLASSGAAAHAACIAILPRCVGVR